jgi:hypothetical protein
LSLGGEILYAAPSAPVGDQKGKRGTDESGDGYVNENHDAVKVYGNANRGYFWQVNVVLKVDNGSGLDVNAPEVAKATFSFPVRARKPERR